MKVEIVRPEDDRQREPRPRRLRAIRALPTLFTLGNLVCGFAAIYFCLRGVMEVHSDAGVAGASGLARSFLERQLPGPLAMAAYLVFFALVCDGIDGRLARMTRRTSDFGGQLDSLADVVSFGVAPAMLMIALIARQVQGGWLHGSWLVTPLGDKFARAVWLMGAAYVACAALRLARYNVEIVVAKPSRRPFRGLPSPGAAGALASLVLLHEWVFSHEATHGGLASQWLVKSLPVVAFVLGLLMISRLSYVHLADAYLGGRQPIGRVWGLLAAVLLIFWVAEIALPLLLCAYVLSGPAFWLARRLRLARSGSAEQNVGASGTGSGPGGVAPPEERRAGRAS